MEQAFERNIEETGETDEEVFQGYLEDLELTPADFSGKLVLDLGSHSNQFARYVKTHDPTATVVGVEPYREPVFKEHAVRAFGEELPFADESVDLIISVAAMPHLAGQGLGAPEETERRVQRSIFEAVRVIKPGGEVRFAPVGKGEENELWRLRTQAINKALAFLRKRKDLVVEEIPKQHRYTEPPDGSPSVYMGQEFLLRIRKLKAAD